MLNNYTSFNQPFTEPVYVIESREKLLYLFGFKDEFIANVPLEHNGNSYKVIKKSQPGDLFNLNLDSNPKLAIIFDLDSLIKSEFKILTEIQKEDSLKEAPFIAINQTNSIFEVESAIKKGIDDCYSLPFQWEDILNRIEFLFENKKELKSLDINTKAGYKIPTGKRIFDILVASGALLFLAPVLALIALGIKLSSKGPILYSSKRAGTSYRVFDFLKFRSMRVGADKELNSYNHLNQYSENSNGSNSKFKKLKNDPRVTTIGKIIRKTSLDELPQLINVLKGDMSIIGNRPLPLYEAKELTTDGYSQRFIAPAGLTGLWQVSKRGKSDMSDEERIGLDIEYADKHSFLMDVKIVAKTLPAMIQEESV